MNVLGVLPYPQLGPWDVGPLEIHAFGIAIAVGLLLGVSLAGVRGEKTLGVSQERVHNFGIYLIIVGWIFSHIFEVVTYQPEMILEDPLILVRVWGSISSVGGILGGVLAYLIWAYRNPDENHIGWGDLGAWTLPICFFFGRVGCWLAFDHPGKEAAEFGLWNWVYEKTGGAVPEIFPLAMESPERFDWGIRHNLGFYEALLWFGIMVLFFVLSRKPRRQGFYLWLLPLIYGPVRFFMDFLRAHPEDMVNAQMTFEQLGWGGDARYLGLTPAQYTSLVFVVIGVALWWKWRNNPVADWPGAPEAGDADEEKE